MPGISVVAQQCVLHKRAAHSSGNVHDHRENGFRGSLAENYDSRTGGIRALEDDVHGYTGTQGGRPAFVVLVSGPAGAGKTTTARRWASSRTRATAHYSIDAIRARLRTGFVDPSSGWSPETERQLDLARSVAASAARIYTSQGLDVIIDDAIFPNWKAAGIERWLELLDGIPNTLVVLLPSLETVLLRNRRRRAERMLDPKLVEAIYADMVPWLHTDAFVVDNSELSPEATAIAVAHYVATLERMT